MISTYPFQQETSHPDLSDNYKSNVYTHTHTHIIHINDRLYIHIYTYIYDRLFPPAIAQYGFFSAVHGPFSKTDHILDTKKVLAKQTNKQKTILSHVPYQITMD